MVVQQDQPLPLTIIGVFETDNLRPVRIVEYKPEHLHDLMNGPLNDGAIKNIGYMREWAGELQQPGWSYTLIENGHIICCAGIVDMWPGVGEAWFIVSGKIHKRPAVYQVCKNRRDAEGRGRKWTVAGPGGL